MNRLKELRQEKKLTQQELADIAEVSKRTYIYWENGESQIKPDKAQKLADYFKVSVGHLLGYSDFEIEADIKNIVIESSVIKNLQGAGIDELSKIIGEKRLENLLNKIDNEYPYATDYFLRLFESFSSIDNKVDSNFLIFFVDFLLLEPENQNAVIQLISSIKR